MVLKNFREPCIFNDAILRAQVAVILIKGR